MQVIILETMSNPVVKYQIVNIVIPNADAQVTVNVNSDKLYRRISGLLFSVPFAMPANDVSQSSVIINDKEIFPENFETKLLVSDLAIPVNERFYEINEPAEGSTIKVKYKDGSTAGLTYPYTAKLYLKLEDKI